MYRLILLLASIPLVAQVTVSKAQVTVTATAGSTTCIATSPATPNVNIQCANGNDKPSLVSPISAGAGNGLSFSYNTAGGEITFLISLTAVGSPVSYQVTSLPTGGCPVGATCRANGTF